MEKKLIRSEALQGNMYSIDFEKIKRGFGRHILWVVFFAFLMGGLGAKVGNKWLRSYSAQSVVIYQLKSADPLKDTYPVVELSMQGVMKMIELPKHINQMKERLQATHPDREFAKTIKADIYGRGSNFISFEVEASSEELAIDLANIVADVVIANSNEFTRQQWKDALVFYKDKEMKLNSQLWEKTAKLETFIGSSFSKGNDVSLGVAAGVTPLQEDILRTRLEKEQLSVEYLELKRNYDNIVASPVNSIASKQEQVQQALLEARLRYAQENPKIKILEEQLAELSKTSQGGAPYDAAMREKLGSQLIAMQARINGLEKRQEQMSVLLDQKLNQAAVATSDYMRYQNLEKEREAIEVALKENQNNQQLLNSMIILGKGAVSPYQKAETAQQKGSNSLVHLLTITGALFGALFGCGIAFLTELFDTSLRTPKQLATAYHLPCLETIPEFFHLTPKNVTEKMAPHLATITSSLEIACPRFSSLAITSSTDQEGKSMLTSQLAKFYASRGRRVLILECDLRENEYLGPSLAQATLEKYLSGQVGIADIIHKGEFDRIKVDKEILSVESLKDLWSALKAAYDLILIDTAGILDHESAIQLLTLADQSLFVIGSTKAKKSFVDGSLERLEGFLHVPVGIVLNRIPSRYIDRATDKLYIGIRKKS